MSTSACAVSVRRNRFGVDVVDEGSAGGRDAGEVDIDDDTGAVDGRGTSHSATNCGCVLVLQCGDVGSTSSVICDDWSIFSGGKGGECAEDEESFGEHLEGFEWKRLLLLCILHERRSERGECQ